MKSGLAIVLVLVATLAAPATQACSFSWKKGWSPEEIKQRSDVRKVVGTYRLIEVKGERFTDEKGQEWIGGASYLGRLDTKRGTGWDTTHEPRIPDLTCNYYFKPEGDAFGTFWISRRKADGRYRLLLWEGTYMPKGELR